MIVDEQVQKANEVAEKALEATKRIFDLGAIACEKIMESIAEQLNIKREGWWWNSGNTWFLQRYGQLSNAEKLAIKRYCYCYFTGTKSKDLPDNLVPFLLISIATRKFAQKPAVIYGVLKDMVWSENQKAEIEPFMYEISEKRLQEPLEVSGVGILSKKGSATVEFSSKSLFEITDDTIGDITNEIVEWLSKKLP
jgi:hypothetical protein